MEGTEPKGLTKGIIGSCENVFNRSRLKLIGGDHDGKIVKATQLKPSLVSIKVPNFSSLQEQESFRVNLPKVFETLLSTDSASYMDSIGGIDYENLAQIGVDLAAGRDRRVVIRTVFGATDTMPLRALSYIIPGLYLAENIKKLTGVEPQLQYIFATHITSNLNSIDKEKAKAVVMKFSRIANAYIEEFFPDIENVVFLQDIALNDEFKDKLIELAELVSQHTSPEMLDRLLVKGESHNGHGTHSLYGGAHVLIHDASSLDILEPILSDQPSPVDPSTIISIGGKQEHDFYKIRHQVKPFAKEPYKRIKTMQYFTKHHVPPYYMDRNGDISLDNALDVSGSSLSPVGKSASFDMDYLRAVSDRRKNFINFLRRGDRYE